MEWGSEREAEIYKQTRTHTLRVFSKVLRPYAVADVGVGSQIACCCFFNKRTCAVTDRQILWVPSLTSDRTQPTQRDSSVREEKKARRKTMSILARAGSGLQ